MCFPDIHVHLAKENIMKRSKLFILILLAIFLGLAGFSVAAEPPLLRRALFGAYR